MEKNEIFDKKAWDKQKAFLSCFEKNGQVARTCEEIGIHQNTFHAWMRKNANGFRDIYEQSVGVFREKKEKEWLFDILDRNENVPPLLRIFALKAIWREKYGDNPALMDRTVDDTLRERVVHAKKQEEQTKPTDDPNILIERQFLESLGKENEHDS